MFKKLSISGAGVKGLISLGCLHYYIESGKLNISELTEFAGTSIGSVICLLILCGYTPLEIFEEMLKIENDKLFKPQHVQGLWEILGNIGILSIDNFIIHIETLMKLKGWKQIPTFKELYEHTKKKLLISAVNITKCQIEYFCNESTPNMIVTDAIKMSCNLPFIFKKIKYQDCYYVDGGLLNNLPTDLINDGKEKTLAINVTSLLPVNQSDDSYLSIPQYFFSLLNLPIMMNTSLRSRNFKDNVEILYLYSKLPGNAKAYNMNFSINEEEKFSLFILGYIQSSEIYQSIYLKLH